jgi:predicted MFS family arabinose efflux permease
MTQSTRVGVVGRRPSPSVVGLLCLAAAAFLSVSTEMLPVGVLPDIGRAFSVDESVTGLLVSLYAVMVAVLAVPLTVLTRRAPRKPLLLVTIAGYGMANLLVAAAPVFAVVAVGRAVGGLTHALFFSLLIGYAPRLVAPGRVARALAIAAAGASAGLVLGVPLCTSLAAALGWRAPFITLTVMSALILVLVAVRLPDAGDDEHAGTVAAAGRRTLITVSTANLLIFLGHFTLYTYVTVLLLRSGIAAAHVGPALLLCGACGLLGTWYVGRFLDGHPRRTVVLLYLVFVAALVVLALAWRNSAAVLIGAAVWNVAFGGVPSLFQTAAIRSHAVSPDLAGAWTNATSNAGIAGGAALGAALLHSTGLWLLPWIGAALAAASLVVLSASRRAFRA